MLFAYAIYRLDPVFMLGQGMGLMIYAPQHLFHPCIARRQAAPLVQRSYTPAGE